ncbi:hypothetical protein [Microseira wollei]|uniref:Uncharacterized protein n=1 Tax=Microseira wollei NIES-4236 TaxID=2530354 RepID=A0AAV3X2N5_9CYAN|nr:hypothetical protein [Microseira wollei]GET35401.1 hypothetical protein MiSe_01430 [Microseira wollei NIES-4236]
MLYLATVQKQTRFFSTVKAELKLLACKRGDNSWSPVAGDEVIPAPEASNFNGGVLVLVDVTASKKAQNIREAAPSLVKILQNFSYLQEKWEAKEKERDFWKEALTHQSAELNRREMELRVQQEQLTKQRQELDKARLELQKLQIELEQQKKARSNPNYMSDAKKLNLHASPQVEKKVVNSDPTNSGDMSTLVLDKSVGIGIRRTPVR